MGRGDIFFAGMAKTALRACIRERLKAYAIDEVFEDELISDLIAQKHYFCSISALRPTHFRKRFRPGSSVNGYDFEGFFLTSQWRKVSWTQCLDPRGQDEWLKLLCGTRCKASSQQEKVAFRSARGADRNHPKK